MPRPKKETTEQTKTNDNVYVVCSNKHLTTAKIHGVYPTYASALVCLKKLAKKYGRQVNKKNNKTCSHYFHYFQDTYIIVKTDLYNVGVDNE